jgi:hypothetical protein
MPDVVLFSKRAGDADFDVIDDSHEQITASAAQPGEAFAGHAQNFPAGNAARDLQAQHRAGKSADHFHAALDGAFGFNFQIAAQIRTPHFETEIRQCLDAQEHEAAGKGFVARQPEARSGRGARRNDQFINFCPPLIGRIMDAHFAGGAAQEIFEGQIHVPGKVALDFAGAQTARGLFSGVEFAIVGQSSRRVAQSFVRRVQFLRLSDGGWRVRIQVGMMLPGEQPVGGANLRQGTATVKAERGVMIFRLQSPSLPRIRCGVSFIAPQNIKSG